MVAVRDDRCLLEHFLRVTAPLVDELIVVDASSVDGSAELAQAAGALVVSGEYADDDIALLKRGLSAARYKWTLCLGVDETLDPLGGETRSWLESANADAVSIERRAYRFTPDRRACPCDPYSQPADGARWYAATRAIRLWRTEIPARLLGKHLDSSVLKDAPNVALAPPEFRVHARGLLWTGRSLARAKRHLVEALLDVHERPHDLVARRHLALLLLDANQSHKVHALLAPLQHNSEVADRFLLGAALLDLERGREALIVLEQGRRRWAGSVLDDPGEEFCDEAALRVLLAGAHFVCGSPRGAEHHLQRAHELRPGDPSLLREKVEIMLERGALTEAARLLDRGIEAHPGDALLRASLGSLHAIRGELVLSLDAYDVSLELQPSDLVVGDNRYRVAEALGVSTDMDTAPPTPVDVDTVSLIPYLAGGAARVLLDVVQGLKGTQAVIVQSRAQTARFGLRLELEQLGVPCFYAPSPEALKDLLVRMRPKVVLHHCLGSAERSPPPRVDEERWVAIAHDVLPLDKDYDHYVILSAFQAIQQRHLPADRITRIPNGVDLSCRRPLPSSRDGLDILVISRLVPGKFPLRFLEYLPPLSGDARVVVLGGGPRRWELAQRTRESSLRDRVIWAGPVDAEAVLAYTLRASIGLHLTESVEEIASIAALEMLAAGLPIVSQPRGCMRSLVEHGVNGFHAHDERGIAAALARLVEDPALRARMGRSSLEKSAEYDVGLMRKRYRDLVAELADDSNAF